MNWILAIRILIRSTLSSHSHGGLGTRLNFTHLQGGLGIDGGMVVSVQVAVFVAVAVSVKVVVEVVVNVKVFDSVAVAVEELVSV